MGAVGSSVFIERPRHSNFSGHSRSNAVISATCEMFAEVNVLTSLSRMKIGRKSSIELLPLLGLLSVWLRV